MSTQVVLSVPKISGEIRSSAYYRDMSMGETAPILLIGHSDATDQNIPYLVTSLQEAVNWLQADSTSPLLRAMLEAYNMGCREIWLYSAAPMSEYRADISARNTVEEDLGNKTFYEKYHERLTDAYALLRQYDIFQVIVPVEASLCETSDIDFATPLAQLCEDILSLSGKSTLGVIGTRATAYNQSLIDSIVADTVFETIGDKGRFIMAVYGEGIMIANQMSTTYPASYATSAAALLCSTSLARSIYGINFRTAGALVGYDLTEAQKEQLAQSKVNPVIRTKRGKRGQNFQTMLVTDNTMAPDESDFWSMNQMRTITECINTIRFLGNAYIGTTASASFKQVVYDYFKSLIIGDFIKDYTLAITFQPRSGIATVDVGITPIFGIRNIYFSVTTGPGS